MRARKSERGPSCEGENEKVSERHNEWERENTCERVRVREVALA